MEYLDLYDINKNLTGEKYLREKGKKSEVPKGSYYIIVFIIIENSKKELLLQKTSIEKGSVIALTGGHVKSGQTSKEAAIEEVAEELGLTIKEEELSLVNTGNNDRLIFDVYSLKKDIDINSLVYQEDEVEYAKFYTKEEVKDLIDNNLVRQSSVDLLLEYIKNVD